MANCSSTGTSKNNSNEVRSGHDGGNSVNEMSILRKMDVDFPTPHLKIFTLTELRSATSNFRPDAIIGGGGFGTVFKGWLDEKTLAPAKPGCGMVTAVEKLNAESMQGIQELQSEINFLGRLSHPNLVKLLGYCLDEKELLLVYEFMAEGSLERHLFKKVSQPFSWSTRLKILIGAARGLAFLHTSDKQVIYRDFKASNILLDSNFHAKLSDFGLAKKGSSPQPIHSVFCGLGAGRLMGTYGYTAPGNVATGDLYGNSDDVYGFGGVLLEMLTGLRAVPSPFLSHLLDKLLDPRLASVPESCKVEMGSYGYAAPEDVATGDLYGNSDDVYELRGVRLVMLLTGLRPLDTSRPSGPQNLVESTHPLLSDRLEGVMDKRLEGQYPPEAALKAAQLSLKCLNNDPKSRPSMKEVVDALEQIEGIRQKPRAAKPKTASPPATIDLSPVV